MEMFWSKLKRLQRENSQLQTDINNLIKKFVSREEPDIVPKIHGSLEAVRPRNFCFEFDLFSHDGIPTPVAIIGKDFQDAVSTARRVMNVTDAEHPKAIVIRVAEIVG
jgi:hypothetical protein